MAQSQPSSKTVAPSLMFLVLMVLLVWSSREVPCLTGAGLAMADMEMLLGLSITAIPSLPGLSTA